MQMAVIALLRGGRGWASRRWWERTRQEPGSGKGESWAPGVKFHCSDLERAVAYFAKGTSAHQVWLWPRRSEGQPRRHLLFRGAGTGHAVPCVSQLWPPRETSGLLRPGRPWAQNWQTRFLHFGMRLLQGGRGKSRQRDRGPRWAQSSFPSLSLGHSFPCNHSESTRRHRAVQVIGITRVRVTVGFLWASTVC